MQIELSFRDMKSGHLGEGLERSAVPGAAPLASACWC